jgi:hypothetical protein
VTSAGGDCALGGPRRAEPIGSFGLAVVALLALGLWLPRLWGPIDLRWDGAAYFTLGASLVSGQGYRLLNEPGDIVADQYPPLFPCWIALHQWALGSNDPFEVGRWLRFSSCLLFVGYGCAIYALLRRSVPRRYALPGAAICLLNLHTYFMSDLCFPEIPYALCSVGFFLAHGRGSPGWTRLPRSSSLSRPSCCAVWSPTDTRRGDSTSVDSWPESWLRYDASMTGRPTGGSSPSGSPHACSPRPERALRLPTAAATPARSRFRDRGCER